MKPLSITTNDNGNLVLVFDRMENAVKFIESQAMNRQWWALWTFSYHPAKDGVAIATANGHLSIHV